MGEHVLFVDGCDSIDRLDLDDDAVFDNQIRTKDVVVYLAAELNRDRNLTLDRQAFVVRMFIRMRS
jgi:hypothetical protein